MDEKPDRPKTGTFVGLGLGMVVCCVGITLLTAGALSGLGAWFFDGGLLWIALAVVAAGGGRPLRRGILEAGGGQRRYGGGERE